jgi:hypothetical protein
LPIEPAVDRAAGGGAGERIGGKRSGAAAEHVARELVEHDDVSQRTGRLVLPVAEQSFDRGGMKVLEFIADFGVDGGILHEPSLRTAGAPITQHVVSRWQRRKPIRRHHNRTFPDMIS